MPGVQRIQLGRQLQKQNRQTTSQTAAWKKRPSERQLSETAAWKRRLSARQLPRQQLGRRDLQQSNFKESSLERHFALATSQSAAWQLSLEPPSFQRRTSSTALSELERTTLHTELERPALTTELAQLQTSSFQESSFELSFEEPSFTAQLCFQEASISLLHGAQLSTAALRGGVISSTACLDQLELDQLELDHDLVAQASPACLRKEVGSSELSSIFSLALSLSCPTIPGGFSKACPSTLMFQEIH